MSKNVKLLLTETVDNLGIVGDVVNVRVGYARNYLLPHNLATTPTDEAIKALSAKRAEAERQQRELRSQREKMIEGLQGFEVSLQRSCNDQGMLYGSVTQQDIADALAEKGYAVKAREVRLPHTIKRIDSYAVPVKFDADLEAEIKVWVVPDRELNIDEREELEFDDEGNLVERAATREKKPREPRRSDVADAKA